MVTYHIFDLRKILLLQNIFCYLITLDRLSMKLKALLPLVLLFGLLLITQQSAVATSTWTNKVDAVLLTTVQTSTVDIIIYLKDQADLSVASTLRAKSDKGDYVYDALKAKADITQAPLITLLQNNGTPYKSYWITNMIHAQVDAALLQQLAKHDDVAFIYDNTAMQLEEPIVSRAPSITTAIEPGVSKINAPVAWSMGIKGNGIVIGGQDTGYMWDHVALKEKYRGWDGTNADHNYNWHDAITSGISNPCGFNSPIPCDDNSHGTHTMGTMVGDDGMGNQIGVAPDAKWIGCRNMDSGNGTLITYMSCFQWFIAPTDLSNNNPNPALAPHVINNSWACPLSEGCNISNFAVMESAINATHSAGIIVVASAGNSGSSCNSINTPPAMFANSFTVGATYNSDIIAPFSSRGLVTVDGSNLRKPDVTAPGVNVRSSNLNHTFGYKSGTSMAGPHVAGTVALILDANPSLIGWPDMVAQLLQETAVPLTTTDGCGGDTTTTVPNNTYGYGRIDAGAAVQKALGLTIYKQYIPIVIN